MFFEEKNNRIILRVKIIPNASSLKTSGIILGPDNMDYLKIYVVSVPEKGKANKELFAFLARLLKIAKSDISLLSGETNHYKKLEIFGELDMIKCLLAKIAEENFDSSNN